LVTHHFALDDIHEAFDTFSSQRAGVMKIALTPQAVGEMAAHAVGARASTP
jgi:hypothetical protein